MEKYIDPRNLVVSVQIGDILVLNVLIDLGVAINVMTKKTMEQLRLTHIRPTPTVLELVDRSKIKSEGVLDAAIVSLYSWEYPAYFIVLQPKNPIGGHPLILGRPWLTMEDAYIGCHLGDMYISHRDARKKVTLYPPARSIQELQDTLCLDYDSSDEETQSISVIQQYIESNEEGMI